MINKNHVNIICTRHNECGNCDAEELYKIIENLEPEVIFEELDEKYFYKAYSDLLFNTLEVKTVLNYLSKYNIKHFPVDTFKDTEKDLRNKYYIEDYLKEKIEEYKIIVQTQNIYSMKYGFDFLNSIQFIELNKKIKSYENEYFKKTNDEEFKIIYQEYINWYNNREHEIIKNIYKYAEELDFNKAILLIGADHLITIKEKLIEYEKKYNNINWIYDIKDLDFKAELIPPNAPFLQIIAT